MMITLHLSDGRKITKDFDKLDFFSMIQGYWVSSDGGGELTREGDSYAPEVSKGCIMVNLDHVIDMRPAEPDEIEHAKIHGW